MGFRVSRYGTWGVVMDAINELILDDPAILRAASNAARKGVVTMALDGNADERLLILRGKKQKTSKSLDQLVEVVGWKNALAFLKEYGAAISAFALRQAGL